MNRVIVVLVVAMVFFWSCGQDKYGDVVELNDKFISITQEYIDGLNKAQSAKDVASAINKYTDGFQKIGPMMKEINKKYPDLTTVKDLPEKVKESQVKSEKIGMEFASSFMKIIQYMGDPQVIKAQERMTEVMQSFQEKN